MTAQVIAATGLPPNEMFTLSVDADDVHGDGVTDDSGAFVSSFSTSQPTPGRLVTMQVGTVNYTGNESLGDYPHVVSLSPGGTLTVQAPTDDDSVDAGP